MYKTKKLITYMKNRSEMEKVEWGLEDSMIEEMFNSGLRLFFGVELDEEGNLLKDNQEYHKGFLDWFNKKYKEVNND
jgi:hypothetical protein